MTLRHREHLADTPRMAEDERDEPVVLVGWTDDDLDYLAEVVEVEHTIAAAFEADGPRVRVMRPGRHQAPAQGAATIAPQPAEPQGAAPPRLVVTKDVAAAMLSMSIDSLERHVLPHIRTVRVGGIVRIPVAEVERWVTERAGRALGER